MLFTPDSDKKYGQDQPFRKNLRSRKAMERASSVKVDELTSNNARSHFKDRSVNEFSPLVKKSMSP